MENPNKKLTVISIRPEHAGEGVEYGDVTDCALSRALRASGLTVRAVGSDRVYMGRDFNNLITLDREFGAGDFFAVRAGKVIEYLYDEANKVMTRID